ncbi:MAG: NUDIX domain-containing protein [Crocinitomicaceae bacterium]|nr:NUDIX domain-containing protein [Crocinitomicaceae bacterium]
MPHQNRHTLNNGISVDCVILGFDFEKLQVLLIERDSDSDDQASRYALPGDLIYDDENLNQAAHRVLKELTGLENIFLEQSHAHGDVERTKRESDQKWLESVRDEPSLRVITVAYYSLVNINAFKPSPSNFAKSVVWKPLGEIEDLAFDHFEILTQARRTLQAKIKLKPIGFNLLPEKFTLSQLHKLYESILGRELDKRNFRRKMMKLDIVERLDEKQIGVPHKPSNFYKFNIENYQKLIEEGYDNFGF